MTEQEYQPAPPHQQAAPAAVVQVAPAQLATPSAPSFFSSMRPQEKLAFATEIADTLKAVIDKKNLGHSLNRNKPGDLFVELEAWQTCGFMCGLTAKTEWIRPIEDGFESRAIIVRMDTGVEVGAAESRCTRAEQKWKNRDDYALSGMASTRAQSRAFRAVLSWIVVLAGYKATPAEEMPGFDPAKPATTPPTNEALPTTTELHDLYEAARKRYPDLPPNVRMWASHAIKTYDTSRNPTKGEAIEMRRVLRELLAAPEEPTLPLEPEKPKATKAEIIERTRAFNAAQAAKMPTSEAAEAAGVDISAPAPSDPPLCPEHCAEPLSAQTRSSLFGSLSKLGVTGSTPFGAEKQVDADKRNRIAWAEQYGLVIASFSDLCEHEGAWLAENARKDVEMGAPCPDCGSLSVISGHTQGCPKGVPA